MQAVTGSLQLADTEAVVAVVRHFSPTDTHVVAAFLRYQVRCVVLLGGAFPHAQADAAATVGVGVAGAEAVVTQVRELAGQCPFQTECGQGRCVLLAGVVDGYSHVAGALCFVADRNSGVSGGCQLVGVGHCHAVIAGLLDSNVSATGVAACNGPLGAFETVSGAAVVVGQGPEGGELRGANNMLGAVVYPGDDAALSAGQNNFSLVVAQTDVPAADGHRRICCVFSGVCFSLRCGDDVLTEGNFVSCRSPCGVFSEHEADVQGYFCVVDSVFFQGPGNYQLVGGFRGYVEEVVFLPLRNAVDQQASLEGVVCGGGEEVVVDNRHALLVGGDAQVGVHCLHFSGLGAYLAVGEEDTVTGEFVVAGAFAECATVGEVFGGAFALTGVPECLVDHVPDETALVVGVAFQCDVFVDSADRVAHCVHVFAHDEGLLGVVRQVLFNDVSVGVHTGFDVGDVIKFAVPGDAFVVYGAVGVQFVDSAVHGAEYFAAVCFVTERPDYYGGVVVVAAHHGFYAVNAGAFPFHAGAGDRGLGGGDVTGGAPGAVSFQVCFVNQVDTVFVGQGVEA